MGGPANLAKTVLKYGISGFGICYCTLRYICGLTACEGYSMEPVIQHGDIILNSPIYVDYSLLKKGDIVFSRSPKEPGVLICKRLKALSGEKVFNNERNTDEVVNEGHVWLEGDNQEVSIDSRSYGPLPYGLLVSRGLMKIWPPHRIGLLGFPEESKTS